MSRRPDGTGRWWGPAPDPALRVGDAERNEVADALSQHFSAGRLDDAELKERLDAAMSAKTGADLSGLLADLPPLDPAPPAQPPETPPRHRSPWVVVAAVFFVLAVVPWQAGPWIWAPRVPWLLVGIVAFALWRRARHRRWRAPLDA